MTRYKYRPKIMDSLYGNDIYVPSQSVQIFDGMRHPPISQYLGEEEIRMLYTLATDSQYKSVSRTSKFDVYDAILGGRGFKRFHLGTNRIVYKHTLDDSFLLKIGLDDIGIHDNIAEFKNQNYLKPMCTKVFDVTPCGTVGLVERVQPFTSHDDFVRSAKEVFAVIQNILRNKYIMEDIGTNFFMNWGYRKNFGPVVLDFPYVYVARADRFTCIVNDKDNPEKQCGGHIDYDAGYNQLVCSKCGQRYAAKDLGSEIMYYVKKRKVCMRGASNMQEKSVSFTVRKGDKVIFQDGRFVNEVDYVEQKENTNARKKKSNNKKQDGRNKSEKEYTTRVVVARSEQVKQEEESEQKVESSKVSAGDIIDSAVEAYTTGFMKIIDDDAQTISFAIDGKQGLTKIDRDTIENKVDVKHGESYEIMKQLLIKTVNCIGTPTILSPEFLLKVVDDSLGKDVASPADYAWSNIAKRPVLIITYPEIMTDELRKIVTDVYDKQLNNTVQEVANEPSKDEVQEEATKDEF